MLTGGDKVILDQRSLSLASNGTSQPEATYTYGGTYVYPPSARCRTGTVVIVGKGSDLRLDVVVGLDRFGQLDECHHCVAPQRYSSLWDCGVGCVADITWGLGSAASREERVRLIQIAPSRCSQNHYTLHTSVCHTLVCNFPVILNGNRDIYLVSCFFAILL